MLSNRTVVFNRSKFTPAYSQSEIVGNKYLLRKQLESDEISRLYMARNIHTKEFFHVRVFTSYFARFINDEETFLDDLNYVSSKLPYGHLQIVDNGFTDESFYIVWPLERIESIEELIKKMGTLTLHDSLVIINELSAFLAYAMEKLPEFHLSLGTKNVYINSGGEVRYADFGVTNYLLKRYPFFNIKDFHQFVAPELNRGASANAGRRSDIFLLSCILFKMLTGRAPEKSQGTNLYRFKFTEEEKKSFSEDFLAVFEKMSANSPVDRYSNFPELQNHIGALLRNEKINFQKGRKEVVKANPEKPGGKSREFIFSQEFRERISDMKDVSKYIKGDISQKDSGHLIKFIFYAILAIVSTFMVLVRFTVEKT